MPEVLASTYPFHRRGYFVLGFSLHFSQFQCCGCLFFALPCALVPSTSTKMTPYDPNPRKTETVAISFSLSFCNVLLYCTFVK